MTDTAEQVERRPAGELWQRSAQLVDVSHSQRTIELVVIPYDVEAMVAYDGRMVRESIDRGAFDGIERRANRVRANREHNRAMTVGRALAFHPQRTEGLVSEVKIARTPLGDETLALAEDGCLDASAAFLPMAGGLTWLTRSAYRITKAWLGHIALTAEPAYDTANVLAVRSRTDADPSSRSATPNLDEVRAWRHAVALGELPASSTPTDSV